DAAPQADAGPFDCAAAWRAPALSVDAAPLPAGSVAMTIDLDYGLRDGRGFITLRALRATGVARPSDGPFSVDENAGHWAELQDADGATLYTRGVFQLIVESLEAPPAGDSGFARVDVCPDAGSIRLGDLPNDPRATQLVLFQDAIDGRFEGPTIEVARFPLPR
ncbi:MAG: hypothetical protein KC549_16370, partial [Myxococcales bacterium]|nr:hypothetical protein [Myxococcales bacterium]